MPLNYRDFPIPYLTQLFDIKLSVVGLIHMLCTDCCWSVNYLLLVHNKANTENWNEHLENFVQNVTFLRHRARDQWTPLFFFNF